MNIAIHEGNENRLVQLTPVPPRFLPPCCLCAQPCPTEPDCAHDGKTQEVKPGIIHLRYSSSSVTGPPRARARLSAQAIQRVLSVKRRRRGCLRVLRRHTHSSGTPFPPSRPDFISTGIVGHA